MKRRGRHCISYSFYSQNHINIHVAPKKEIIKTNENVVGTQNGILYIPQKNEPNYTTNEKYGLNRGGKEC